MPEWREEIARRLTSLKLDSTRESDIIEELSQHLEDRYLELVSGGATDADARRDVLMELNYEDLLAQGLLGVAREARQGLAAPGQSGPNFVANLWQDLRYAVRQFRRNPGFAAVAIITLALGIGASTAIFSVVYNVLLEPFPYKDAGHIVFPRVHGSAQTPDEGRQGFSSDELLEFARQNHSFESVIGTSDDPVLYKRGAGVEWLYGAGMTPGSFEFFGMPALYGRVLQPADYKPGAAPVFVMRYKTWKSRFNSDPEVLNKIFVLNGTARTLVGIMPPRFGWYDADLWIPKIPVPGSTAFAGLPERWFVLARLKPGVSMAQAGDDLTAVANRLAKLRPQDYPAHFQVFVEQMGHSVAGHFQSTLYTVLAAVGLLLLIGCVNVANLMLARATARGKEFALRAVLGAGRGRLVRLLLVESLVLAMGGAALGVMIAWGGLKLIVATMPVDLIPAEAVIALNPQVMAFTLVLAVLTPLIFGLVPALQAARRDLNDPLRDMGRGVIGGFRTARMRDAAVVMEVAVSLALLVGAGLLMHSFLALRQVKLGLQADHVFKTFLLLPPPMALMNEVEQAVWASDPGVALVYPDALEHAISKGLYAGPRFALLLMIIFACVGLILVTVGVYSVLAYTTAQRTHEIGIRMALGAERANVLRLVILGGLRLVLAGVAVGVVVSLLLGRAVESALWPGVKPYDPATLASTVLLLLATGVVACWIPARRAARVDPMVALRYE
jgi:ABC-type antimicrobial peptide transport system permease subunit